MTEETLKDLPEPVDDQGHCRFCNAYVVVDGPSTEDIFADVITAHLMSSHPTEWDRYLHAASMEALDIIAKERERP